MILPRLSSFACILALSLFLCSCETLAPLLNSAPKPKASLQEIVLQEFHFDSATLGMLVDIENPYVVSMPLQGLTYEIRSSGAAVAQGIVDDPGTVPARGSHTVSVPVQVVYTDLLGVLKGIQPGVLLPYEAHVDVNVETPGGPMAIPLSRKGELPIPAAPRVSVEEFQFNQLSLDRIMSRLVLSVENRNVFPIDLEGMHYQIRMGGRSVADGEPDANLKLSPGIPAQIEIPFEFSPRELGLAGIQMITRKKARYALDGDMKLGTAYGPLDYTFSRAGNLSFDRVE